MGQSIPHKTAILVFAHSSEEEQKHKASFEAKTVFDALTKQTLDTVAKTGLPYFHYTEKQQSGATFGERFTNAIQAIFEKGYQQIITLGNDSPHLKSSQIIEAERQLNAKRFVLGPSVDGGFYLMGIRREWFDAVNFRRLSWQKSSLSKELIALISQASIPIVKLSTLRDIDVVQDIKFIIGYASLLTKRVFSILSKFLQGNELNRSEDAFVIKDPCIKIFYNKGSPSFRAC